MNRERADIRMSRRRARSGASRGLVAVRFTGLADWIANQTVAARAPGSRPGNPLVTVPGLGDARETIAEVVRARLRLGARVLVERSVARAVSQGLD